VKTVLVIVAVLVGLALGLVLGWAAMVMTMLKQFLDNK
jgi:uncharacterized membrane protein